MMADLLLFLVALVIVFLVYKFGFFHDVKAGITGTLEYQEKNKGILNVMIEEVNGVFIATDMLYDSFIKSDVDQSKLVKEISEENLSDFKYVVFSKKGSV